MCYNRVVQWNCANGCVQIFVTSRTQIASSVGAMLLRLMVRVGGVFRSTTAACQKRVSTCRGGSSKFMTVDAIIDFVRVSLNIPE